MTGGFRVPSSPPAGCTVSASSHCCRERRETNLVSKGSQEGAPVNPHSATTSAQSCSCSPGVFLVQKVKGIYSRQGKDTTCQASGGCCLVTSSPAPASDTTKARKFPFPQCLLESSQLLCSFLNSLKNNWAGKGNRSFCWEPICLVIHISV